MITVLMRSGCPHCRLEGEDEVVELALVIETEACAQCMHNNSSLWLGGDWAAFGKLIVSSTTLWPLTLQTAQSKAAPPNLVCDSCTAAS